MHKKHKNKHDWFFLWGMLPYVVSYRMNMNTHPPPTY